MDETSYTLFKNDKAKWCGGVMIRLLRVIIWFLSGKMRASDFCFSAWATFFALFVCAMLSVRFTQIYYYHVHRRPSHPVSTGCPPVDHRMSHPHASGNVPEVVHRMCRIRWTTGCAASGGPLDVCMRWTTRCVHAVDHWMCACSAVVCTWWKSDGQPDVSIEWLAFGVLCSLSLFMGK